MPHWFTNGGGSELLLALLVLAMNACGGEVAGTDSGGLSVGPASSSTATTPTTGYEFDDMVCGTGTECVGDADCCVNCPNSDYPYNWTCNAGTCVNGGCDGDLDCENMLPDFTCHSVGGNNLCVAFCTSHEECKTKFQMEGTCCTGAIDTSGAFCQEYPGLTCPSP